MLLGQGLEPMETLMMTGQVVRSLQGSRYVLLVVSQMGSLLVILGEIYWEEYLVQIVGWRPEKDKL